MKTVIEFWFGGTAPVVQGEQTTVAANVPVGVFLGIFGVVFGAFLIWYLINRRRGE